MVIAGMRRGEVLHKQTHPIAVTALHVALQRQSVPPSRASANSAAAAVAAAVGDTADITNAGRTLISDGASGLRSAGALSAVRRANTCFLVHWRRATVFSHLMMI
jgi:hypothetical protein